MNRVLFVLLFFSLLVAGCGVNKAYIEEQIAASDARTDSRFSSLSDKTDLNAAELEKLKLLATELGQETDMAIDKASGFENYQVVWSGEINFDFDSHAIAGPAGDVLNEAGQKLESVPSSLAEFVGHADRTGSSNYNLMLGEMRANSGRRYLSEKYGISLYRMFVMSYGKEKPVAMPDEHQAASRNRRVVVKIWGPL